jgi:hypothetical protein
MLYKINAAVFEPFVSGRNFSNFHAEKQSAAKKKKHQPTARKLWD